MALPFPKREGKKPRNSAGAVRVASTTYQKALLKKVATNLLLAFFALVAVYFCFAATIIRAVPSDAGLTLVKNNTYPGGILPHESTALITLDLAEEVPTGVADKLQQSVLRQSPTAVVQVLAGPIGKVKWVEPGILTVDGATLPIPFPEDPGLEFLAATAPDGGPGVEYVGVCVEGACAEGTPVFFRTANVLGVPISQEDFSAKPDWDRLKNADRERPTADELGDFLVESGVIGEKQAGCVGKRVEASSLSSDLLSRTVADVNSISDSEFADFDAMVQRHVKACKAAGKKQGG